MRVHYLSVEFWKRFVTFSDFDVRKCNDWYINVIVIVTLIRNVFWGVILIIFVNCGSYNVVNVMILVLICFFIKTCLNDWYILNWFLFLSQSSSEIYSETLPFFILIYCISLFIIYVFMYYYTLYLLFTFYYKLSKK